MQNAPFKTLNFLLLGVVLTIFISYYLVTEAVPNGLLLIMGSIVTLFGMVILGNKRSATFALNWSILIFGLLLFTFVPTLVSITALLVMAIFHAVAGYQPQSIDPLSINQRNFQSFALLALIITDVIHVFLLEREEFFELQQMTDLHWAIIVCSFFFAAYSVYLLSFRSYENIQRYEAQKEKDWTSNVFTLLSHNVKTPVAALTNRIEIIKLKHAQGIPPTEKDIISLSDNNDKLIQLVHSLMSTTSKAIINQANQDFFLIQSVIEPLKERCTIDIKERIIFEVPSTMKMALDLTLDTLVSNSEKYGASEIIIELIEQSNDYVLSVKDNGEGMDQLSLGRYGSPFNTVNSKQGGSGIGVYFAFQLIENEDWRWTAESTLGIGTTVSIFIPKKGVIV